MSFECLTRAGLSDVQARALVKTLADSIQHLATKANLQQIRIELDQKSTKVDLERVCTELKEEIAEVKIELSQKASETTVQKIAVRLGRLEESMLLLQKLFFGGFVSIMLGIAALFMHQA
jgi:hypothetical protein